MCYNNKGMNLARIGRCGVWAALWAAGWIALWSAPAENKAGAAPNEPPGAILPAAQAAAPAQSEASFRRIYVARHGQRPSGGDPALTPLGERQGHLLGERILADGFRNGRICASPYLRTVQTAVQAAEVLGATVHLEPLIQERTKHAGRPDIAGLSQAQLEARFPGKIASEPALPENWVYTDNIGRVLEARVAEAIDRHLACADGDLLLVGHKATVQAALKLLSERAGVKVEIPIWNCTLIYFAVDSKGRFHYVGAGTGFVPPDEITNNEKPGLLPSDF